jgi:hypothetical protein
VLRAAREFDELGQDAASGDIERQVNAVGGGTYPLHQAVAVGDVLGAQLAQVVVRGRAAGPVQLAACPGELDGVDDLLRESRRSRSRRMTSPTGCWRRFD